jgi:hypothetical protein
MSQKQVTTDQFAPAGMSAYNQLMPQAAGVYGQYMQDPFKSSFFQQMMGMGNAQIGQQGQTQTSNLLRNAQSMGGGANPYLQSLMAQQGRATSGQQAGFMQNMLGNANQSRMWAAGNAAGFRPLQTGQTQQTSGLGTWLPQLIGAGLGVAAGAATGGKSMAAGGLMHGTMGAMGSAMSPMQSPFLQGGFNMPPNMQPPNVGGGVPGGFGATPPMFPTN